MEEQRVNALRLLGETIANYIMENDDKTMFARVYRARRYWEIRMLLIKMSRSQVLRGKPPVISFDDFITVFEEGEEAPRIDWRLAWDLVIIRVIETLYQNKWLQRHQEELLESEGLEEEEEEL
jgi:CRISPR-associated protein Cst1